MRLHWWKTLRWNVTHAEVESELHCIEKTRCELKNENEKLHNVANVFEQKTNNLCHLENKLFCINGTNFVDICLPSVELDIIIGSSKLLRTRLVADGCFHYLCSWPYIFAQSFSFWSRARSSTAGLAVSSNLYSLHPQRGPQFYSVFGWPVFCKNSGLWGLHYSEKTLMRFFIVKFSCIQIFHFFCSSLSSGNMWKLRKELNLADAVHCRTLQ